MNIAFILNGMHPFRQALGQDASYGGHFGGRPGPELFEPLVVIVTLLGADGVVEVWRSMSQLSHKCPISLEWPKVGLGIAGRTYVSQLAHFFLLKT